MSSDLDALELILRIRTQGQETLTALRQSLKELDTVATSTQGKLNQALGVGDIAGPATESIKKLTGALGGLGTGNFASTIRTAIQNPLYAIGQAAEKLILSLGPIGGTLVGIGTAAGAVSIGVFKLADSFASASREITNFSLRTGLSIRGAQEFSAASKIAGLNASTLEASTRQLSSALADNGLEGTRTSKALQTLGIQARTLSGELRPMDQLLPQIFSKLNSITDEADRNTLALTLFGRAGKELLPFIGNYTQMVQAARNSGVIINPADIENGKKLAQTFAEIGLAYEGMLNKLKIKSAGVVDNVLGAFGRGSINDAFNQADDFARNPKNAAQVAKFGYQQSTPNQGGLLGFVDQTKIQDLTPFGVRSPFDTSNLKGASADALDRQANRDKINAILRQFDPQAAVTQAEAALKDSLAKLDPVNGTNIPAGAVADIQRKSAAVNTAREAVEFPKQKEQAEQHLLEAQARELTGAQRINAEYEKQIQAIGQIKGLTAAQADVLTGIATKTRDAQRSSLIAGLGKDFQAQQRETAQLQERLTLSGTLRTGANAAAVDLATGRIDPNSRTGIDRAFQDRIAASNAAHQESSLAISQGRANLTSITDPAEKIRAAAELDRQEIQETARVQQAADDAAKDREVSLAGLRKRDAEEAQQTTRRLAEITISTTKALGATAATRKSGPFDATPTQQIFQELQTRLQVATQVFQLDSLAASQEQDANKRAILNAENLAAISKEDYAARTTAENALYDLQKQRYEQAKSQAHSLAGALLTPGGVQGFVRDQSRGFATQVLGNALTPLVGSVSDSASKIFPAGGPLGNLFKGTFLQPHDEQNVSLSSNTKSTVDNTAATAALAKIMVDMANGRTPETPNLPGVPALAGTTSTGSYGPTSPALQNLLAPLIGAGVGASLGHSLASTFEPPALQNITADKKTFDPRYQLTHPLATLAGGTVGAGLGLLSDATRHTSGVSVPGIGTGVTQLVPIQQQALEALQQIYSAIANGGAGLQGLPVNIQGAGGVNLPDLAGSGVASLSNPLAAFSLGGLFAGNPAGSAFPSSGGDSLLDSLPLSSRIDPNSMNSLLLGSAANPSGFAAQAKSFASGMNPQNFYSAVTGSDTDAAGNGYTGASRAGAIVGGAGALIQGGTAAYADFKRGGGQGAVAGVGQIAGTAAMLDPEPVSKTILGAVALTAGIVSSIMGNPKTNRQNQINTALSQESWDPGPSIQRTLDTHNMNVIYGADGKPMSTTSQGVSVSPNQSYYFNGQYSNVPGVVTQNYNSPAAISPTQAKGPVYQTPQAKGGDVHVHVNAMDSKSILDRSQDIGMAVLKELQMGSALSNRVQSTVLGG